MERGSGGGSGGFKSCDSLMKRVEDNESRLVELVILPMKNFEEKDVDRLSSALGKCMYPI